jgi:hypothetical protein
MHQRPFENSNAHLLCNGANKDACIDEYKEKAARSFIVTVAVVVSDRVKTNFVWIFVRWCVH